MTRPCACAFISGRGVPMHAISSSVVLELGRDPTILSIVPVLLLFIFCFISHLPVSSLILTPDLIALESHKSRDHHTRGFHPTRPSPIAESRGQTPPDVTMAPSEEPEKGDKGMSSNTELMRQHVQ